MGMNAVVIVENSRHMSFTEFIRGLESDKWGKRAFAWVENHHDVWKEFEWEGKKYFSWMFSPRILHTGLYDYESDWDHEKPDASNDVQITFLKILLAVEKLAGGPVYVGNDVICPKLPRENEEHDEEFFFPAELDSILTHWRNVETIEPTDPHLVF